MSEPDYLKGSKLSKLLAGRERPVRRFDLEVVRESGPETLRLAVRTLSTEEQAKAHAEATKFLTGLGGWRSEDILTDLGNSILNLEVMVQTLALALVDPERPSSSLAADAAEVRRCFDVDELRACFDEYERHALERSPFRHLKTLAEVREVADALGKGLMQPTSLQRYDVNSLQLIITSLVDPRRRWTTPSSSDTSPPPASPDDSSPNSSTPTTPRMTVSDEPTQP